MPTIRRLYLYAVALVSVEVVLWGAIGLARSFFAGAAIGGSVAQLAGALALILVGVPVFLIHWLLAQRLALHDPEERSARLRAIFLYGALLVLLLPAAQNALALFDRLFLSAFGQPLFRMMFGASQSASDNLVAILLSLAVAAYFYTVLLSDWRAVPEGDAFPEVRRLYRYIWLFYGLLLVFFGVQQVLLFILTSLGEVGAASPLSWGLLPCSPTGWRCCSSECPSGSSSGCASSARWMIPPRPARCCAWWRSTCWSLPAWVPGWSAPG